MSRCLDVDETGRVWVGGQDEFGYLAADSSNNLKFYSIANNLPELYRSTGLIRQVYCTKSGTFFSANGLLIRVASDLSVKVWTPKSIFHRSYYVENVLLINQKDIGLSYLSGDSLKVISGGEFFGIVTGKQIGRAHV